jgi:hypothetical protein
MPACVVALASIAAMVPAAAIDMRDVHVARIDDAPRSRLVPIDEVRRMPLGFRNPTSPMDFAILPDVSATVSGPRSLVIHADGMIEGDTPQRFLAFLRTEAVKPGAIVLFNSTGGDPDAAVQLGRLIRQHGLHTAYGWSGVGRGTVGSCWSACTIAFLGGVRRSVFRGGLARYGFDGERFTLREFVPAGIDRSSPGIRVAA